MEGKKEKHEKNELVIKLDCIKKAKDLPFTLTCKRGKIKSYIYFRIKETKYDINAQKDIFKKNQQHITLQHILQRKGDDFVRITFFCKQSFVNIGYHLI